MKAALRASTCPGCGLRMPVSDAAAYDGYYNTSPECWSVYAEVLGSEYSDAVRFGQVHQLTVDTYAVQHAGGPHPDKSVAIHLSGLYLVLEQGLRPTSVPKLLQRLAEAVETWPHFPPPGDSGPLTVFDVALSDSTAQHIETVRAWAGSVWEAWSPYHADVAAFVADHLAFG